MNAEEYFKKKESHKMFTPRSYKYDFDFMIKFAEEYHQSKLKNHENH